MLSQLSDELLLESYLRAVKLNLSHEFLLLLVKEIEKRSLVPFTPEKKLN